MTADALLSLIISHYLLRTREFMFINHTDCKMLKFKDDELLARLQNETETAAFAPNHFHAFGNFEENARRQIQKVKSHPGIPKSVPLRGFVYDVKTGRLHEVTD